MHRNSLLGASPAASFLYNLTKNLAAHLHHQLCAVLPLSKNRDRPEKRDGLSCFIASFVLPHCSTG
ncbi:MAG: hypothetical protein IKN55_11320 [Oscillospiraceae bacterium]|nr:hypothetical protein [Oscillospiraceae bacterium]